MKILQKLLTRRWRGKSHLAAFMLVAAAAATAWSATPLAVWNGDFDDATTRNGVTFDVNGNTVNKDGTVTISSEGSGGIKFTVDKTYNYITTVFTVKNLNETAASDRVLVALGGSTGYYTGVYLRSGGLSTGGVNGNYGAWGTDTYDGTVSSVADANTTRTFAATQVNAGTLQNGFHLYEDVGNGTSGGTIVYGGNGNNGLYGTQTYDKVLIGGGLSGSTGSLGSMTDLVVVSVAIYVSDTVWPLDSAGRQNFAMPGSFPVSNSTSISVLNTLLTNNSISGPMFVNLGANVYLTADAKPASNLVFPNDATIAVDGTTLTVTGGMPVKPGSSITSVDGSGTVVYTSTDTLPTSSGFFADTWTGTVKISGATLGSGSIANLGNANSTIELAGDGLTIDTLSANMTFAGALTGDGTLNVTATPSTQYTTQFTGNCTAFAGSVTIAQSGKARVAFGNNNIAGNNNCLVVGSDATVTVASGKTWTAPGGFVIRGNMTLSGNLGGGEKVYGDTGVITVTSDSAKTGLTIAQSWTGTVKIAYNPGNVRFFVGYFGSHANATVEIVGADGAFGAFPCTAWANGTAPSITPIVKLSTTWTVANGWDNATTTFSKLTGTGNLIVNGTTSSDKAIPYKITRIENFTGAIGGNRGLFTIGTVVSGAEPTVGAKVVSLSNCTKTPTLTGTTVVYNNNSYYITLDKQNDGLYVAAAATVGETGYSTVAAALNEATASDAVVLNMTGETVSVDSITAASLTVNGTGEITVSGDVNVSGAVTFTPDSSYTLYNTYGSTYYAKGYTLKLTAGGMSAGTLNGAAAIVTTSGLTAAGGTFYGKVAGDISSSGNFTLQAPQTVSGELNVTAGTLTVGPRVPSSYGLHLDASDTSNMTITEGSLTAFTTPKDASTRTWSSTGTAYATVGTDENYFGGTKPVMVFNANAEYAYTSGNLRYGTLFAVYQTNQEAPSSDTENVLFTSHNGEANDKIRFGIYKKGYQTSRSKWYGWNNSSSQASNYTWPIFLDGSNSSTSFTTGKKSVLSFASSHPAPNTHGIQIGCDAVTFVGAVAEIIGLDYTVSLEERAAIEAYLMQKWDCTDKANFTMLASTAEVTLSSGSTLDLGGYAQTVKSLSGSGTVQNGTLTVTYAINLSAGDVLTLPNTAVFTLGTVAAKIVDTTAGTVTLCGSLADAISAYSTGTLTILQSLTDVNLGTTEASISGIVLADGVSAPTFAANPPFTATYSEGTLTNTRSAATFVYTGDTAYSPVSGNFTIGGVATTAVPGTEDTVQFDTATSIYIGIANIQYAAFVLNADVTVTGAGTNYLRVNSYTGTGTLKLAGGASLAPQSGSASTIASAVEITGSNVLRVTAESEVTTVTGKLTGNGTWQMSRVGGNTGYSGNIFRCDASEFSGTIEELACDSNVSRNFTEFGTPKGSSVCDFSGATVTLNSNRSSGKGKFLWVNTGTLTYKFGSLSGKVSSTAANYSNDQHCYIEIGALGNNDVLTGDWISSNTGRNPYLRKVGTGTLTTSVTDTYGYILNGGTLVVTSKGAQVACTTELSGYEVVTTTDADAGTTTYTLKSTVPTWTGKANDSKWSTEGNWDNGVPTSATLARFPAGTWTVFVDTDSATCAGMDVLGTVEFAQTDRSVGVHNAIALGGNVTGSGTVKLTHVGLNNTTSGAITFSPNLEVLAPAANANSDSWLTGSSFTLSGTVTATGRFVTYNVNTFTGEINVPANGSFDSRADQNIDGSSAVVNINGWFGEGFSGTAKWLFPKNGAVINLNAGGTLSVCRITGAGYTLNFNGGTLTEYADGNDKDKIIGGLSGWDDGVITLNVKSGGLSVSTAIATTIAPALAGDSESTGGGLTKYGAGTLTLATAPTFTGAITVAQGGGTVVVPIQETYTYTLGANTGVTATDTTAGTRTLAYVYALPTDGTASFDSETDANNAAVTLTTAQEEQGLQAGYYKTSVVYDSDTGKWVVTAALNESVVGGNLVETATVNVSAGTVTLGAANLKPGLCYRIVSGGDATSMSTAGKWSDYYDGSNAPTLTADLPTGSAPMYYSVEASDTK